MMMRHIGIALVLGAAAVPFVGWTAHYLGHGLSGQPSQRQVDRFCNKQYREISQSPQYTSKQKQEADKLYKQYCQKQPSSKPTQPADPEKPDALAGRIDRIEGPSCAKRGSEIRVRGRDLRRADLTCRLESKGQRRTLRPYSRTEQEYRFRLEKLLAGPDHDITCEVTGDRDGIRLQACPTAGAPAEQTDGTDLVPQINAEALRPGEMQTVEVSVLNRGRSQPGNQRHRLILVLADRDLSRAGASRMSSALSPTAARVLAHERRWVMRVPGAGGSERVAVAMMVPEQLSDGEALYWCALADSDEGIPEVNENNNLECVPASGGGGIVARQDLSGVFGSAVRKPGVEGQIDPDALRDTLLPSGATTAALEMVLRVNGSFGIPPVHVSGADETLMVSHEPLPAEVDGQPVAGIVLRFKNDADFAPDDCGGGPAAWTDDLNTSGYESREPGRTGSFVVDLTQSDAEGARVFRSGESYYVKGCLFTERDSGARFIDHPDGNTNTVPFTYGSTVTYVTETEFDIQAMQDAYDGGLPQVGPEIDPAVLNAASFTDLSIVEFKQIPSGRDRGKILVVVKAQPVGGEYPAQDSFPVVLRNGSEELWSGTGHVRNILGLWGDWIVTDYEPSGPVYVTAEINRTPHTYDEAGNTHNNSAARAFNWDEPAGVAGLADVAGRAPLTAEASDEAAPGTYVDDVTRTDEGPDWSRIRVDYHVVPDRTCRVVLWAAESGTRAREDRVRCDLGHMRTGANLSDEFLCRVQPTVIGDAPFRAQEWAGLDCRDSLSTNMRYVSPKEWTPRSSVDAPWGPGERERADYFIPFAHVKYRDGKPVSLRVNVSTTEYVVRDGWLNPRITVDAMSADRVVLSKTYQIPTVGTPENVGVGTHIVSLREEHGWRWELEEAGRRYSRSRIQVRIHSVIQRPGDHTRENDIYDIELRGVQPRS